MDFRKLEKSNALHDDIQMMKRVISEAESKKHWISVISPGHKDAFYSVRFQDELVSWLKEKVSEYQKELDEL